MAEKEYVINIKALIDPSAKTGGTTDKTSSGGQPKQGTSRNGESPKNAAKSSSGEINHSLSAMNNVRYAAGKVNSLASVFGNEDLSSAMQAVTKAGGFMVKGAMALSGDPVAIIDCVVSAIVEIASAVRKTKQEEAAKLNEQDIARIQAGLFDIEGVEIGMDTFSGRLQYEGK